MGRRFAVPTHTDAFKRRNTNENVFHHGTRDAIRDDDAMTTGWDASCSFGLISIGLRVDVGLVIGWAS